MPPTTTLPRRSLIGRIFDAVAGLARSVTAVARTPGNGRTTNAAFDANEGLAAKENQYDAGKCVVGSIRTYCRNCQRYHRALVPLQE